MRTMVRMMCAVAVLLVPVRGADEPAKTEQKQMRVLVITGHDVQAHDWRATTPVLREYLEKTGRFEVVVCEEPLVLESSALAGYDVILLNYYNWNRPSITPKARENLVSFVKGGKGLVSFHYSCRSFQDWPEYKDLIGRQWRPEAGSGHGPRGTFKVKVVDKEHFITQGLPDFEADDELYAKLTGDAKIHVLAEAYSEWSKQTEPMAWTLDYGKGRVFNIVLGHDVKALKNPSFGTLLERGTEWVARGDAK